MPDTPEVVIDCETSSLRPDKVAWEIAMHRTTWDEEGKPHQRALLLWVEDFDPSEADPKSLEMNGFWDRHPRWRRNGIDAYQPPMLDGGLITTDCVPERDVAARVFDWTRGSVLIACNTAFDAPMLASMLQDHRYPPLWHYSPTDLTSWCAGVLGLEGRMSTSRIAEALGFTREQLGGDHSAMGDVLYALRLRNLCRLRLQEYAAARGHGATVASAPA